MKKVFLSVVFFIQFIFLKLIFMWTNAVEYIIIKLQNWAITKGNQIQQRATKLLMEGDRKKEVDSFVKSMQRQAKITGARPKKDLDK